LFGFNLPATHHFYYLASNFTDLWRRINIYWKDFISKIFFNPVYFRLKRLGAVPALVLSTLIAFVATWLLHAYQFFWIGGSFQLTWQDMVFWSILAMLVLVNTLTEAKRGRRRRLTKPRRTVWSETSLALRTITTFVIMCMLWILWCRPSADEMAWLVRAAGHASWAQAGLVAAGLAGLGVAAVIFGHLSRAEVEGTVGPESGRWIWRSAIGICVCTTVLLLIGGVQWRLPTAAGSVVSLLTSERPNELDLELQRRGYYEALEGGAGQSARDPRNQGEQHAQFVDDRQPKKYVELTNDFMHSQLKANYRSLANGKVFTINRWGMRDRDYDKAKPPGVYRILLLGSSNEMGIGVGDNETFENLVEDRLNANDLGDGIEKFEILNVSRAGHAAFQKLHLLEEEGFGFAPDAVLWVTYSIEDVRTMPHLTKVFKLDYAIPEAYRAQILSVFEKAQLQRSFNENQMLNRMKPLGTEILRFSFRRLAQQCGEHGVKVWVIYRPDPFEVPKVVRADRTRTLGVVRDAGLPILNLINCYSEVADRHSLMVGPKDDHANTLAHRLLADELYKQLHPSGQLIFREAKPEKRVRN
jgi:hypothetical protein